MANNIRSLLRLNLLATAALVLVACGDGASTVSNPNLNQETGYTGPAPRTEDIRSFMQNFWTFLEKDNRCGQCHGVDQAPTFVDKSDVNKAYSVAVKYVSLVDPASSQIVQKAATGHHCWLGTSNGLACADNIEQMIINWATASDITAGRQIQLSVPDINTLGNYKTFPDNADEPIPGPAPGGVSFEATIHPILTTYCQNCHTDTAAPLPIAPFFANADPVSSYEAAKAKMDIDTPALSRFVVRLRQEAHNCWSNCADDANTMEAAIQTYADAITPQSIPSEWQTSAAMNLVDDGIIASGGNRHEVNLIALWEFREGDGATQAFDTSGIDPSITLNLTGSYSWLGGFGLDLSNGYAFANNFDSVKLKDFIETTGEYSIELWIVPSNVTQQNANIISYSGGPLTRNFGIDQEMYAYRFYNRIDPGAPLTVPEANGEPFIDTADSGDEIAQADLQHVVVNYDPFNGREIYVDGQLINAADPISGSTSIGNVVWDQNYGLIIGNDFGGGNNWAGQMRLIAIHNRTLTPAQIQQNLDVGVGQKYFLLFWVGEHMTPAETAADPTSFILFEVSQFDQYSYLFSEPRFVSLDDNFSPPGGGIPIKGIRIGVNGREAVAGQAFANIDTTVTSASYDPAFGQLLSPIGTVIALEKQAENDVFFLTFEAIGGSTNVYSEAAPTPPATPTDPATAVVSDIGTRTYEEIAAAISAMTGIATTDDRTFAGTGNVSVEGTYNNYFQQLPAVAAIDAFLPSHQMAVAQLALASCNTLVETNANDFFGPNALTTGVLSQNSTTTFGPAPVAAHYDAPAPVQGLPDAGQIANRDAIITPLLAAAMNVINDLSPDNLTTQPDAGEMRGLLGGGDKQDLGVEVGTADEYDSLISQMLGCRPPGPIPGDPPPTCTPEPSSVERTKQIAKAVCATAVGSAAMLVQ